jgi:hypothetical protein
MIFLLWVALLHRLSTTAIRNGLDERLQRSILCRPPSVFFLPQNSSRDELFCPFVILSGFLPRPVTVAMMGNLLSSLAARQRPCTGVTPRPSHYQAKSRKDQRLWPPYSHAFHPVLEPKSRAVRRDMSTSVPLGTTYS